MIYRILILLFIVSFSCDNNKQIDREAVKKEMKTREVKRLTEAEIMEKATIVGDMAWKAVQLGDSTLMEFVSKFDIDVDTMKWGDNPFTDQDKDILEAYQYAIENKLPIEPGINGSDGKIYYFYAPYIENEEVKGVITIKLLKKDIVLSID